MKYRESQVDKDLRAWFAGDFSKALLRNIQLRKGSLRGINSLSLDFNYPIVAFCGINGAGKSTILAMACCAYHNQSNGFKLPKRKNAYYTFSDFFIQLSQEVAPQGIEIFYGIAHNNWKNTEKFPGGVGIGSQLRKKKKGGKWNDYADRIKRNVVFLGIERIVPHIERSQSKSYSRSFADVPPKGWEAKVKETVGYILSKKYDEFRYLEYARYSLPIVNCGGVYYSGFNMGAGENALFEIFSTMYAAGKGALLVMDEIELGLHAKAQRRFMEKLKVVCKELGIQVICTTHSKQILECLPEDARFFVESVNGKTKITEGISPEFAFQKLGAIGDRELTIFVEDQVAKALLEEVLPADLRNRSVIKVIGSAAAIARQLAASYVREDEKKVIAIFDGDQKANQKANIQHAGSMAENTSEAFKKWFGQRIGYLPGDTWPEAWMIQRCAEYPDYVADSFSVDTDSVPDLMEYSLQAGKHNEFYELANHVGLGKEDCLRRLSQVVRKTSPECFEESLDLVRCHLDA